MASWKLRLSGLGLLILGGVLFVWAVKYIGAEWPQIFMGLLAVFCLAMGFGLLIMPLEEDPLPPPPPNNSDNS